MASTAAGKSRQTDGSDPGGPAPDPLALAQNLTDIAGRTRKIVADFAARHADGGPAPVDASHIISAFTDLTTRMMADPAKLMEAQAALWSGYVSLWQNTARRMMGMDADPVAEPARGDRRFKDAAWTEHLVFDYIKQSYLLSSRWISNVVEDVEGPDDKTNRKIDFYTRQFTDAMSPSNFLVTNPEVLRTTLETKGENLVKGLDNLLADLDRGAITMTDTDAFEVGRNIATTPGSVVFENELMQLVQYAPTTETVARRPLLIIPPWINKFYILDLSPRNSFIKWAVEQGLTVFVISWVNPGAALAAKSFEDYMFEGPLQAAHRIKRITGQDDLNVIGYCLGGTLLSATLAYLKARGVDDPFHSATYFATLVDFEEAGELSVFIDEEQLSSIETRMSKKGYLEPKTMALSFNLLRANDLIWSFVVNNYLMGKDPFPFDLLYWNSDSTAMPAAMHSFYLRKMYHENKLVEPGGLQLGGVDIDLRAIDTPIFILSTHEDHIAPWKSTYAATQIYSGPVKFVLSGSGHIAGVINPPSAEKYGHWVNKNKPKSADAWLNGATRHGGSWWPEWARWISRRGGGKVPARIPAENGTPVLEPAPGRYVRVRAVE